jgi:hypothetical protein
MSIVKRSVQSTGFVAALAAGVVLLTATDDAGAKGGSSLGASNLGASMAPHRNTVAPSPNILHPAMQRPAMSHKDVGSKNVSHNDLGHKDLGRMGLSHNDRGGDRQVKTKQPSDKSVSKRETLGRSGKMKAPAADTKFVDNSNPGTSGANNNPLPGSVGNNNIHPIINTNPGTNNNIHPIITNAGTANAGATPSAPPMNTAPPVTVVVRDHRGEAPTLPGGTYAYPDGKGGAVIAAIPTTAPTNFDGDPTRFNVPVVREHRPQMMEPDVPLANAMVHIVSEAESLPHAFASLPGAVVKQAPSQQTGLTLGAALDVVPAVTYGPPAAAIYGAATGGVTGAYSSVKSYTKTVVSILGSIF